ncbi:hypothetical protein K8W59_04065 [Nocardioides rotundus]|uniref:hypothetical protein n=1 Tax=Nocardioides rotundus TaxID=1774216 RepID=UPI001CC0ADCD|nr:hypothetical protein [Nocardioides rotundus]UAL30698.1 hypothetical protein K8W59_04065 [Nocardioides rotundus]
MAGLLVASRARGVRPGRAGSVGALGARRSVLERVEVACAGGRGRTGTALACIAIADGVAPADAVAFVRAHYDRHAVGMPWQ